MNINNYLLRGFSRSSCSSFWSVSSQHRFQKVFFSVLISHGGTTVILSEGSWFWRSALLFVPPSELFSIAFEVSPPTVITAEVTKWSSAGPAPSWFGCNAPFVTASETNAITSYLWCNRQSLIEGSFTIQDKFALFVDSTVRCHFLPWTFSGVLLSGFESIWDSTYSLINLLRVMNFCIATITGTS